jgi:hypothetical protein
MYTGYSDPRTGLPGICPVFWNLHKKIAIFGWRQFCRLSFIKIKLGNKMCDTNITNTNFLYIGALLVLTALFIGMYQCN